jgi:hypothetical protein
MVSDLKLIGGTMMGRSGKLALAFSGALFLAGCDSSSRSGEQEDAPQAEQKAETDPVPVPDAAAVAREISAANYGEAARLAEAALSDRPGDPEMYLLLARAQARLQNVGSAVNALQAAFDAGFHDPRGALNHPDFDGIRTNRIFAEFVSRFQRSQSKGAAKPAGPAGSSVRAGDVSITEDSNGKTRIRAGDIVIED